MAFRPDIIAGRAVILVTIQDQLDRELRRIRTTMRRFSNSMSDIGGDLFRFGALGTIGAIFPIRAFVEFQDQMLFLQTKLQITDEEIKDLEKSILELGRTTSFTSTEVAKAATELAKASFNPDQIKASLQDVLDLGRGAQISLTESSKLLVNTLKNFGLSADMAGEVASTFIVAARHGTIDVLELKESIKETGGTFNFLTANLKETLAAITALSFSNIKGTKAGTSLNTMFLNMTRHAKGLNEEFGVKPFKGGSFIGMIPFLEKLEDSLKKLTVEEQITKLTRLFNIRGNRAEMGLFLAGVESIKDTILDMKRNTDEARLSAKRLDSQLGGFLRRAKSAWENLNIAVGKTAEGPLSAILLNARRMFTSLEMLASTNPEFVQFLLLIPPAALLAGAAILILGGIFGKIAILLSPLISLNALFFKGLFKGTVANLRLMQVLKTMKGFRSLAFSGSGVFLFLEALVVFGDKIPVISGAFKVLGNAFKNLSSNLGQIGGGVGSAFGIILDGFRDPDAARGIERMKIGLRGLIDLIKNGLKKAWSDFWQDMEPITSRISALFRGLSTTVDKVWSSTKRLITSFTKLLFGESGVQALEKGLAAVFSPEGIEFFASNMLNAVTAIIDVFTGLLDVLNKIKDTLLSLPQLLEKALPAQVRGTKIILEKIGEGLALLPEMVKKAVPNQVKGMQNLLDPSASDKRFKRTDMILDKAKELQQTRANLAAEAKLEDQKKRTAEIHAAMAKRFSMMGTGLIPTADPDVQLQQVARGVASSLIGSFASTRGAKLQLQESSKLDTTNDLLGNILTEVQDGQSF